jgi:thiamine biosynthesis lipoprotein ApbE
VVESGNITESYRGAGYSSKGKYIKQNAHRLYEQTNIKAEINRLLREADIESIVTVKSVLSRIDNIANDETANKSDRLRALELEAKYLSMLTDRTVHEVKPYGPPPDPEEREAWLREELGLIEEAKRTPPALAV